MWMFAQHRSGGLALLGLVALAFYGCGESEGPETATLVISSAPVEGATVTIGGIDYGKTPTRVSGLPAGSTYVQLSLEGYKRKYESVTVPETGELEVKVRLDPVVGFLSVQSDPAGAEVYLNGVDLLGRTPIRSIPVPVGEQSYELRLKDYVTLEATLLIEEDFRYPRNHILEAMQSHLQVFSRPSGGTVLLNEVSQRQKTPASFTLPPGDYTVVVQAKGFIASEKTVRLAANETQSLELVLDEGEVPPGMVLIPAGEFMFGYSDISGAPDERPERKITRDAFYMDKFEVTNEQFREVFPTHTFVPGKENVPASGVSWHQASEYAKAVGKRLPTEEEWEKAARGPEAFVYPWGNAFKEGRCNSKGPVTGRLKRIGSYRAGVSAYGCMDMAGNVSEWVHNVYGPYPGNEDVPDIYGQVYRTLRGGSFLSVAFDVRTTRRHYDKPESTSEEYGFRCAMDIPEEPPDT